MANPAKTHRALLSAAKIELKKELNEAAEYVEGTLAPDWAVAERYFAGEVDAPKVAGRSTAVKTEVRDTIRALKPSILRTLLQARKIVEYEPSNIRVAAFVEQQAVFVTQLFWANDGYKVIYDAADEALKKRLCPIKTYWEENPTPEYFSMTGVTQEDVVTLRGAEDFVIETVSAHADPVPNDLPQGVDQIPLFDVTGRKYNMNGRIRMEAFPANEYIISPAAPSRDTARVHGHRREVTVAEALELGLSHPDWASLDGEDSTSFADENKTRRKVANRDRDTSEADPLNHKFLLTECYTEYDLRGDGHLQKYCFWFGGTSYEYISHEEVDDWCIDVVEIDPVPFSTVGRSIVDLTKKEQDTNTSLLRAIVDNAHIANNPRFAANPMLVDFEDLMNNGVGAPIKVRGNGAIQPIDTPFTGGQLLPLMQYMEADVQSKVGVTKAAQGLDPNAMQSTDKQAVQNTIALAQGQTELIVRNIIETGLIPVFKRLLRLSIQHMDRQQIIRTSGLFIPIDTSIFDPDLVATPNVGLGTASPERKLQALSFVLQKQEQILGQFGMDNPFTSLLQVYNTLEDIVSLSGLPNVGRYFKVVTPEIEQQLAKQRAAAAEAAKKAAQPKDPAETLLKIEEIKAQVAKMADDSRREAEARKNDVAVFTATEAADLARDKLAQDRVLALLKVQEDGRRARADAQIRAAQIAPKMEVQQITQQDQSGQQGNDMPMHPRGVDQQGASTDTPKTPTATPNSSGGMTNGHQ